MGKARASCLNVSDGASERDWMRAHAALTRLARERAAADAEEGRWLLLAWRSGAHVFFGHGSFSEYVERLLGYSPRATREKLRVAEALEGLPLTANALERGEVSWCAARELTRVATTDTESAWLAAAGGKTTRELERLVAGKHPGELPPRTAELQPARRHVLRFEVAPETFATFREATLALRRAAGGSLDDDTLLLAMARHVLGAPENDGRSSHRLSYELCPDCGRGGQVTGGELVPVSAEILAMAACDGERMGVCSVRPANENHSAENTEPDAKRATHATHVGRERASPPRDDVSHDTADEAPDAASGTLDEHLAHPAHENHRLDTIPADASLADRATHVGRERSSRCRNGIANDTRDEDTLLSAAETPRTLQPAPPRPRARQGVPPALRRAVLARDRHCCRVPGCRNALHVDVHHVRPRSEGGRNTLDNLITLCTVHHRAVHRGQLLIAGSAAEPSFRHADGTPYGEPVAARPVDAHAKVFAALRHLGFRERDAHAVLAELRADIDWREAPVERLLREALRRIRPASPPGPRSRTGA